VCTDVALDGRWALVADGADGIRAIDLNEPESPREVGRLDLPGDVSALGGLASGRAFAADADGGLWVVQAADGNLSETAHLDLPGSVHGVAIATGSAYTAGWGDGVAAWSLADRRWPTIEWRVDTPGRANAVAVTDRAALVADLEGGLRVIQLDTAPAPREVANFRPLGLVEDVAVKGAHAFVVDGESLLALDVSVPASPREIGRLDRVLGAVALRVADDLAVAAQWEQGLFVIDVTGSSTPRRAATVSLPGGAAGLDLVLPLAYVASDDAGLHVVDVSIPAAPRLLGTLDTPGHAEAVGVSGNRAVLADSLGGVHLVDVDDPSAPLLLASLDTPGNASGVAFAGDTALVADGAGGLRVLRVGPPPPPGATVFLPVARRR
jgi:hypothetical protein